MLNDIIYDKKYVMFCDVTYSKQNFGISYFSPKYSIRIYYQNWKLHYSCSSNHYFLYREKSYSEEEKNDILNSIFLSKKWIRRQME